MTKKTVVAECGISVGGIHYSVGDVIETDVETADFLVRHQRASDPVVAPAETPPPADDQPDRPKK